jgi:tRNA (cytidine/uridine-2'-O-)-methyltransferase
MTLAAPTDDVQVVLVEPEIHWNVGNAGRTCLAVGAQLHLVKPLGFSLDDRQVRRAGLDYWEHVRPRVWSSFQEIEPQLADLGEPFFFSAREGPALWDVGFPRRVVFVFGRESVGLAPEIRERYRARLVQIPILDERVRSLNLSTSVALALYEVLRQRRATDTPAPS